MPTKIDTLRGQLAIIKESLNMKDVAAHYGIVPNRSGFANCPFHTEKTGSMKLYENNFKCFGCHTGGDIVDFVSKYNQTDFKGAIQIFQDDFGLDLGVDSDYVKRVINPKVKARKIIADKLDRLDAFESKMVDKYRRCRNMAKTFYNDEVFELLFIDNLNRLRHAEYIIDEYIPYKRKQFEDERKKI
jgi:DNA primase